MDPADPDQPSDEEMMLALGGVVERAIGMPLLNPMAERAIDEWRKAFEGAGKFVAITIAGGKEVNAVTIERNATGFRFLGTNRLPPEIDSRVSQSAEDENHHDR